MKTTSAAHSLIELLCVTCVISILADLLLPPVIRAYRIIGTKAPSFSCGDEVPFP